jgi:hypothetical protein
MADDYQYEPIPVQVESTIGSLGLMAKEDSRANATASNNSNSQRSLPTPGVNTAPLGAFPEESIGEEASGRIGAILYHNGENWRAMYAPAGEGPFVLMHPGRGEIPYWEETDECEE